MDIEYYYENTELTLQQIANKTGLSLKQVYTRVKRTYSSEYRKKRKAICYRNSKLGDGNPMRRKFKELHHNYKGLVSDNKGYLMVLKPGWYTGRKNSKHVFEHHIVVCQFKGITEIPAGYNVHHLDHNPLNNDISNLVLLTRSMHQYVHQLERATTSRKA